MMKAAVIRRFGGPDVLEVSNIPRVHADKGTEVCVRVRAIGVNPIDTYIRAGEFHGLTKPPFIPGYDAAGTVESTGPDVKQFQKGDRVYLTNELASMGTYAEYVVVNEAYIGCLPDSLTFEQGAAIGIPYLTSYRALFKIANAEKGESILIHGASGGVGLAAVQMAKAEGLTVIGTAGSSEGLELVRKNGADFSVNHNKERYADEILEFIRPKQQGIDIILEMLANKNLEKDIELADRCGRIVVIGSHGPTSIDPGLLMGKEIMIRGVEAFNSDNEEFARMHRRIEEGVKEGWLQPCIEKILPLEKANELHREMGKRKAAKGRNILVP